MYFFLFKPRHEKSGPEGFLGFFSCSTLLLINEPRCEKTGLRGFPTRSDKTRAVQPQKMARGMKFRILEGEGCTIRVPKTMALISFAVTANLICVFVFA